MSAAKVIDKLQILTTFYRCEGNEAFHTWARLAQETKTIINFRRSKASAISEKDPP